MVKINSILELETLEPDSNVRIQPTGEWFTNESPEEQYKRELQKDQEVIDRYIADWRAAIRTVLTEYAIGEDVWVSASAGSTIGGLGKEPGPAAPRPEADLSGYVLGIWLWFLPALEHRHKGVYGDPTNLRVITIHRGTARGHNYFDVGEAKVEFTMNLRGTPEWRL